MKRLLKIFFLIFLLAGLATCTPNLKVDEFHSGDADFTTYVALGNSITAGMMDDALYPVGQRSSYPAILAHQFQLAGGGIFNLPLMTTPNGAQWDPELVPLNLYKTITRLTLTSKPDCNGKQSLLPIRAPGVPEQLIDEKGMNSPLYIGGPIYHNLGVPGIKITQINYKGLGDLTFPNLLSYNFNPFYWRFSSHQTNASVLTDALRAEPTFFSIWLGNNDVLFYATSGGTGFDITPIDQFETALEEILMEMSATKARGVIANIPDITTIPYFITVPYDGLHLNAVRTGELNDFYKNYPAINFSEGDNPFVIADPGAQGGRRLMKPGELVLLAIPLDSIRCAKWGAEKPIPNEYILTEKEVNNVKTAIDQYNSIILTKANIYNLALADMNGYLKRLHSGFTYDGISFTANYISGGAFSLDGIHPTQRAHAMIANEFIRVINEFYNSAVPFVDVTQYDAVLYP